ncbi:hypothetical protein, partial [Thermogutta sp.]|uniref:hypothetical protein n=1 Tax=Thermogutta sp. TaxID=1962930 RepID=UPI0032208365
PCMFFLRCAFSGILPARDREAIWEVYSQLKEVCALDRGEAIARGFVRLNARRNIFRVMGGRATASMGAVVAHHTTPLSVVLRELRRAEKQAKEYGRNAFCVKILKRAGGALSYTASWGFGGVPGDGQSQLSARDLPYNQETFEVHSSRVRTPMSCLFELRDTLALPGVSRRAVYNTLQWLQDLPPNPDGLGEEAYKELLVKNLAYQFARQGVKPEVLRDYKGSMGDQKESPAEKLADTVVEVAFQQCRPRGSGENWLNVPDHLSAMLQVAEFLAREGRAPRLKKNREADQGKAQTVPSETAQPEKGR